MGVVKINIIDPQLQQRLFKGLVDILWLGVYNPIGIPMCRTELRREEDLIALSGLLEPTRSKSGR